MELPPAGYAGRPPPAAEAAASPPQSWGRNAKGLELRSNSHVPAKPARHLPPQAGEEARWAGVPRELPPAGYAGRPPSTFLASLRGEDTRAVSLGRPVEQVIAGLPPDRRVAF